MQKYTWLYTLSILYIVQNTVQKLVYSDDKVSIWQSDISDRMNVTISEYRCNGAKITVTYDPAIRNINNCGLYISTSDSTAQYLEGSFYMCNGVTLVYLIPNKIYYSTYSATINNDMEYVFFTIDTDKIPSYKIIISNIQSTTAHIHFYSNNSIINVCSFYLYNVLKKTSINFTNVNCSTTLENLTPNTEYEIYSPDINNCTVPRERFTTLKLRIETASVSTISGRFITNFNTLRCRIEYYLFYSEQIQSIYPPNCTDFEISNLLPSTKYAFNYTYEEGLLPTMHIFTTKTDHVISTTISRLICDRMTLEIMFTPTDDTLGINSCNTTIISPQLSTYTCKSQKCENSCSNIVVTGLTPGTNYVFNVHAPLKTSSHDLQFELQTPLGDGIIISFNKRTQTSLSVSSTGYKIQPTKCNYELFSGNQKVQAANEVNCSEYTFSELYSDTNYTVRSMDFPACQQAESSERTYEATLVIWKLFTNTVIITVDGRIPYCNIIYKPTTTNISKKAFFKECEGFTINKLRPSTEYTISVSYNEASRPITINIKTLPDHIINLLINNSSCTSASLTIGFIPAESLPINLTCKTQILFPVNAVLACDGLDCENSCYFVNLKKLISGTSYTLKVTVSNIWSSEAVNISFKTKMANLFNLISSEVTSRSFRIAVISKEVLPIMCNFTLSDGSATKSYFNVICNGYTFIDLQPEMIYVLKMTNEAYCVLPEIKVITSNVPPSVPIPTINASEKGVFHVILSVTNHLSDCILTYKSYTDITPKKLTPSNCSTIMVNYLSENTLYDVTYVQYGMVNPITYQFTTLVDYNISINITEKTCTSAILKINFYPIPTQISNICNTNIILPRNTALMCQKTNCEKSCSSIFLENLNPNTKYTLVTIVSLLITDPSTSFEFTTSRDNILTINAIGISNTTVTVTVSSPTKIPKLCNFSLYENVNATTVLHSDVSCRGYKFIQLIPNTMYTITLLNYEYCSHPEITVLTDYTMEYVINNITTKSISVNVMLKPAPIADPGDCTYTLSTVKNTVIKVASNKFCHNFNYKSDNLEPNTDYKLELHRDGFVNEPELLFKTFAEHKLTLLVSVTCNTAYIAFKFDPIVESSLSKYTCRNKLSNSTTFIVDCVDKNCATSCNFVRLVNITPASYIFKSTPDEHLSSSEASVHFKIHPRNPYVLTITDRSTTSIIVGIMSNSNTSDNCIVYISGNGVTGILSQADPACNSVKFINLLPNTEYTILLENDAMTYCDKVILKAKTEKVNARIKIISTASYYVVFSIISEDISFIPDCVCTFKGITKEINTSAISKTNDCSNITIENLQPDTYYQFTAKSNYLVFLYTIDVRTDTYYSPAEYSAILKDTILFVEILNLNDNNNKFVIPTLIEVLSNNQNVTDRKSMTILSDELKNETILDSANPKANFKNLKYGITYILKICAVPTNSNCSIFYGNCFMCTTQYFITPKIHYIASENIEYVYKSNSIILTYTKPDVETLGDIKSIVIYVAKGRRALKSPIRFYKENIDKKIDGNKWQTVLIFPYKDMKSKGKIDINLFSSVSLYDNANKGYYYYLAIGYCTNITCVTSEPYEKVYISKNNEKMEFITFLVFAIVFSCLWILFIVLYSCFRNKHEKFENSNSSHYLNNIQNDFTTLYNVVSPVDPLEVHGKGLHEINVNLNTSLLKDSYKPYIEPINFVCPNKDPKEISTEKFDQLYVSANDIVFKSEMQH